MTFNNVNDAFCSMFELVAEEGIEEDTRYGPVYTVPYPVCWSFRKPWERVLFNPVRDCNPFFHVFESMWMLAGRNDVETVAHYCKKMEEFSDDGVTINDAYGYRWRNYYNVDQLDELLMQLVKNPGSRRLVLSMWDIADLVNDDSKALPCNTHIYFRVRGDFLDMTVCNRSNDLIWGALGANAVHFSVLQEYLAVASGYKVGMYYTLSNNLHAYRALYDKLLEKGVCRWGANQGYGGVGPHYTMDATPDDAQKLIWDGDHGGSMFIEFVVIPMCKAWACHKSRDYETALEIIETVSAMDWRIAGRNWLKRRRDKWQAT